MVGTPVGPSASGSGARWSMSLICMSRSIPQVQQATSSAMAEARGDATLSGSLLRVGSCDEGKRLGDRQAPSQTAAAHIIHTDIQTYVHTATA